MSATFDFFVAALQCEQCGAVSPADSSTNMQTKVRAEPDMESLGVGDRIDIRPANLGGYIELAPPAPGSPVRLLDTWSCPTCHAPQNWAEIVVRDGVIAAIRAVPFDRSSFERAHWLKDDADSEAAALAGIPVRDLLGKWAEILRILRERLPPIPGGS